MMQCTTRWAGLAALAVLLLAQGTSANYPCPIDRCSGDRTCVPRSYLQRSYSNENEAYYCTDGTISSTACASDTQCSGSQFCSLCTATGVEVASPTSLTNKVGRCVTWVPLNSKGLCPGTDPTPTTTVPGTKGDPLVTGFDGKEFAFIGEVDAHFNLISEHDHQLNGYMTDAIMHDHNGTYFVQAGLKYKDIRVKVATTDDGTLEVEVNGEPLTMNPETRRVYQKLTPEDAGKSDAVLLTWEAYKVNYGNAVQLETPMLRVLIWSAPPGPDAGGVVQKAYLNFNTALLSPPLGNLHGIIGRTYTPTDRKPSKTLPEASSGGIIPEGVEAFNGIEADFKVPDMWSDDFRYNQFGVDRKVLTLVSAGSARRSLIERWTLVEAGLGGSF